MKKSLLLLIVFCFSTTLFSQVKLTFPTGGEKFVGGSDTLITWEGTAANDTVSLYYSIDDQKSWNKITDKGVESAYLWQNIPNEVADDCIFRIHENPQYGVANEEPIIEWKQNHGTEFGDVFTSFAQTPDSGFILAGTKVFPADEDWEMAYIVLYKIDSTGKLEWEKEYNSTRGESGCNIKPCKDGFIFSAYSNSSSWDYTDPTPGGSYLGWLCNIDEAGNILWSETYADMRFNDIVETYSMSMADTQNEWGYICAGGNVNKIGKDSNACIRRVNDKGISIWHKTFEPEDFSIITSIHNNMETKDIPFTEDECLMTGMNRYDSGNPAGSNNHADAVICKLTPWGSILWTTNIVSDSIDIALNSKKTADQGYVISGWSGIKKENNEDYNETDYNGMTGNYWIAKIDKDGNIEWKTNFGGSGYEGGSVIINIVSLDLVNSHTSYSDVAKIHQTPDGGYLVAGTTRSNDGDVSYNHGESDYWLVKFDSTGNMEWEKTYGGDKFESLCDMERTPDGGYLMGGWSNSQNSGDVVDNKGYADYWVVKIKIHEIDMPADTVNIEIVASTLSAKDVIDMGLVLVSDHRDSTVTDFVHNTGAYGSRVDSIYIRGQHAQAFSLIGGIPKYYVEAGAEHFAEFRFEPYFVGQHRAEIVIITQSDTLAQKIIGDGFSYAIDSLRLRAGNISSYDNKIIFLPIIIDSIERVKLSGITAVSTYLQYNSTLLYPSAKYARTAISPTIGQITLSDLPLDQAKGDILTTVMFKTGLGNAEGCDLVLLNPVLTGKGTPEIITENGYFSLLGVCHEGGARLFSDSKMASGIHAIRPNPASNYISIEIGIIEKGYTEVAIYDVLGKKITTVFAEDIANLDNLGERTISADLSDIANGQYMLLFTSPTYVGQKAVVVWK